MFKLEFATDNAAFDDNPGHEAARILREIAAKLDRGDDLGGGPVRDSNGNKVGRWELTPYTGKRG